jgi:hypothetical protein
MSSCKSLNIQACCGECKTFTTVRNNPEGGRYFLFMGHLQTEPVGDGSYAVDKEPGSGRY